MVFAVTFEQAQKYVPASNTLKTIDLLAPSFPSFSGGALEKRLTDRKNRVATRKPRTWKAWRDQAYAS